MNLGDTLPRVELFTADGQRVEIGRFLDRPLVIQCLRYYLQPSTWRRYLRSARVARQGRLTGDLRQAPGVVILDADRRVRCLHRGGTLGDYPPVDQVLDALRALTGGPG